MNTLTWSNAEILSQPSGLFKIYQEQTGFFGVPFFIMELNENVHLTMEPVFDGG